MGDLFDYLAWRGDILFSQVPPTPVDALIFSALSYVEFDDIVPENAMYSISLREAAKKVLELPDLDDKFRVSFFIGAAVWLSECFCAGRRNPVCRDYILVK